MRDQIDMEQEAKNEALRTLSKANAEIQQWKTKFESEALLKMEEMEDSKRKLVVRMNDLQEQVLQGLYVHDDFTTTTIRLTRPMRR